MRFVPVMPFVLARRFWPRLGAYEQVVGFVGPFLDAVGLGLRLLRRLLG
jgi:hypothetical protein